MIKNLLYNALSRLDNPITNARKAEQFYQISSTDNPSTLAHSMVEYLRDLKKQ